MLLFVAFNSIFMKPNIVKYLIEVVVITFSILVAFWLETWRDDKQEETKRKEALVLIRDEIVQNYSTIEYNINKLKDFNEHVTAIDILNGDIPIDSNQSTFIVDLDLLDSLKEKFPANDRIQRITPGRVIDENRAFINTVAQIDFFLGEIHSGMWKASINSGVLIGADPITVSMIARIYDSFEEDFGYSDQEYHKAIISTGYDEFTSIMTIIDATFVLERSMNLRKILIDKHYKEVIDRIDRKIKK